MNEYANYENVTLIVAEKKATCRTVKSVSEYQK